LSASPDDVAPSPCIGLCRMDDARGVCEGCWRTLAEIAEWGRAPQHRRLEILREVSARRRALVAPDRDKVS
jgi:predicted Fe-S protein YdhL (DUF1289 family)